MSISTLDRRSTAHRATSRKSVPAWEHAIRLHTANLKHCIATEDFQYVQASKVQDVNKMLLATSAFGESPPQANDKIKDIQTKDASEKEQIMGEFTAKVRDLPNSTPNQNDWINKINEQREKAKKQSSDGIDAAADKVIATIQELPPSEQNAAADFAVTASNFVMNAVGVLVDKLKEVAGQIADFFKGIWDGLKTAYNAVSGAVSSAVNAIRGLFGFSAEASDSLNGSSIDQQSNGDVAVGPVVKFIGRLNWPAAVGMASATAGLAYVTDQLLKHQVIYSAQTIERVDSGGRTVIETKTTIAPMKSGTAKLADEDLSHIWLECVGDLGNDGHYVPAATAAAAA